VKRDTDLREAEMGQTNCIKPSVASNFFIQNAPLTPIWMTCVCLRQDLSLSVDHIRAIIFKCLAKRSYI